MMRAMVIACCCLFSFASAQEIEKTTGEPRLQSVFNDDFQTDTRGDYEIEGDVTWESGTLTLDKGASIQREINGGAWAKVELDFAGDGWGSGDEKQELRIRFLLGGATDCYVRLRTSPEGQEGQSRSVALVDTEEQDGKPIAQVVREMPLAKGPFNRLSVEYRHGLVTVTENQTVLLMAHIENGAATLSGFAVHAVDGSPRLKGWIATCLPASPPLTEEQQRQAAEATSAEANLIALYQQGKFAEAAAIGERVLEIRKQVLGEENPEYATSLNYLAFSYIYMSESTRAEALFMKSRDIWKKVLGEEHPEYARSLYNLARLYAVMGKSARAESLYVQACNVYKQVLGEEHPDYTTSLSYLARLYTDTGDYARAEPLYLQARDIYKQVLGEEHPDFATSLNNLADVYTSTGEYAQAEPLYVQACKIYKKVLGEEHSHYTTSLNNLAEVYRSMFDYARAEPLYIQACKIRKKVLGEEHPDYATSLHNLATLYYTIGEYARAKPLYVQACDIEKKALGEEHPDYATSLHNLASLYKAMGESARAEPLYVQALDIRRKVLGEEHPSYAGSLNSLASLYANMSDYARAESLYLQALDIQKKVLGVEHPDYATSLNNLAALYKSMGESARAEPLYVQARNIWKKVLGEEHPDYALSLNNLANLYDSIGEYALAESLYVQALDIRRKVLGEEHPDYAESLASRASLYANMGDYDRAESLHLQAREIWKKALGEEHPDYALSLNNLAGLYADMGDYAQAESLYLQTLDIQTRVLGEKHPDYSRSLNNLANLYNSMREYALAESLYVQARDTFRKVFGEEHSDYAQSLNNLATLYTSMGEYALAEPLLVQARDIQKKLLGEEHPGYATSLINLASLYRAMGEYARAKPLCVQARDIWKKVLGEEHSNYATSLTTLAALYRSMGEYDLAEPLHLEAQRVLSSAAARAVPSLSEAQARSWMEVKQPRTDLVLSALRLQQKWDSSAAYTAVWSTKGMVRRLQVGQSLSSTASPAASETFAQLRDARLKLAKLVSATPSPEQADDYRQTLATANERKEILEKRLAELNTATARELAVRDAKVDDLLQKLPEGVAVVDFVRLADWEHVETEIKLKKENGETETRTVKKEIPRPVYDAFVLRADSSAQANPAKWIPLGAAEPIENAIAAWRTEFAPVDADKRADSKEPVADPEQKLRKLIWDKLEPHLDGIHTVVVIPDGALNRLPWAAIPGRNDGEYLLHDYALTTAATGQQLYGVLSDPRIETKPELLVVGGIEYDKRPRSPSAESQSSLLAMNSRSLMRSESDFGWSKLHGTQVEAKAIAALWGDRGPLKELGGIEADEHSLARLLPQSRFAHLATHGFFDTRGEVYGKNLREQSLFESSTGGFQKQSSVAFRNPLLMTGIVMAGANVPPEKDDYGLPIGDDGILTAEEISGLDLRNTELVTLSACETGLGDIAAGEGVYGLTRVLHKSGVRSVLASQWKVSDLATQELMRRFYENLWVKKQSKLEALRNAQLWMLNHPAELQAMGIKNATTRGKPRVLKEPTENQPATAEGRTTPYFWAAFQLSGDWR